jgi:hypothetical protein
VAPEQLARYEELGVGEVLFGLPDKEPHEVETFIARFGQKLGH